MKRPPVVTLALGDDHGHPPEWIGSLLELLKANSMGRDEARDLTNNLRIRGHALMGGGAAPLFYVRPQPV